MLKKVKGTQNCTAFMENVSYIAILHWSCTIYGEFLTNLPSPLFPLQLKHIKSEFAYHHTMFNTICDVTTSLSAQFPFPFQYYQSDCH